AERTTCPEPRASTTRHAAGAACSAAARRADVAPPPAPAVPAALDSAHAAPLRARRDRLADASVSSARVDAKAPAGADDEGAAARRAAAARARGARADLREVRPGDLDAARPAIPGARVRAREAAGPRAAVPVGSRRRGDRAGVRP